MAAISVGALVGATVAPTLASATGSRLARAVGSATSARVDPRLTEDVGETTQKDDFSCFSGCGNALVDDGSCLRGRDWTTTTTDKHSSVAVLSFHGGGIEKGSTELALALSKMFGWSRYDFNAHPTSSCLQGSSTFSRLHITATHFNDPVAVALVGRTAKAVAIHGYSPSRGLGVGEVCVGGANSNEVQQFISSLARYASRFSGYSLRGIDATGGGSGCSGLTGTASANLVNRNQNGGLQLEMSNGIKADMANSSSRYSGLRSAVIGAIKDAMATS